ncbi:MAG: YitT family protein [Ardenticatenales bacterium]|nr:YitT family protein [Ardenticatenales bacterium]
MSNSLSIHPRVLLLSGWARRLALLMAGLILFGIGVALMARSGMGLGPWEAFHQGLALHTGLEMGAVSIFVGMAVLLAWIPLRQWPGIGTVLNILTIGTATDMTLVLLPTPEHYAVRLLWMVVGLLLTGLGCGMYLSAKLGAGPRDGVMMGLHKRTGLSIRTIRTLIEVAVLVAGWLMGGQIGLGTVAFAFGIGPIVQPVMRWFGGLPSERGE